jgi:predicted Ser/Thr protein kinase
MKATITLDEKDQQLIETIFEDKDKEAAYNFVVDVIRAKVHEQVKGEIKCGNIFSTSGEKK